VGRGDQIDIVAASGLELQHDLRQTLEAHHPPALHSGILADLMVLAVDTTQIAIAKKDVSGPPLTRDRRLFAKMRSIGGNNRQVSGTARSLFILKPVYLALPGAHLARGKSCCEPFSPFSRLSRAMQPHICWDSVPAGDKRPLQSPGDGRHMRKKKEAGILSLPPSLSQTAVPETARIFKS
jgi:hypothetical protein